MRSSVWHISQLKDNKLRRRIARIVSDFISPPLVFAIVGFLFAWYELPFWRGLFWGAFYGFFVSLIPVLLVLFLYRKGLVQDMHMSDIQQRRIPYMVSILGALIVILCIALFKGPKLLSSLALSNFVGLIILFVINNYWLISSHMASTCMAAFMLGIYFGIKVILITIPLVLIVFWARYILGRHTYLQLLAGMAVGIFSVLLVITTGRLSF